MLAVDLDSTLIGKDHKVNAGDAEALQKALAAGIRVALCTGRNIVESAGVIGALQLSGLGVFANGATIADMATGLHLQSTCMPRELCLEVVDFFGGRGHAVLGLVDHPETRRPQYVRTDHGPPHRATVEWLIANKMHAVEEDVTEGTLAGHVVRLGIVVDVPDAKMIEQAMDEHFGARLMHHSIYSKHYDCQVIETFAPGVNKWTGILEICRREGLDPRRVVTIGDDTNDIAMLENATLSFAVANAPPAIRARAKRITATQAECGVARVVEEILRGKN
jgi:Cof subfamily protein (haloacid dehalogenase superfamily)